MGTLCQLEHELQQLQGFSNLFCYSRILVGIYYLWKLSNAELYRSSSRPKYLTKYLHYLHWGCSREAQGHAVLSAAEIQQCEPSPSKGRKENGLGQVACGVWGRSCAEEVSPS